LIDRLQIDDFQRHRRLRVELDRVTTFVGGNDVGKSAVVRALRWLATNRPAGDAFVREGAKTARVRVRVDKQTVERKRGAQNSYSLGKQQFKAFGSDVPESVARLLNIGEVNFQGQHDPSFWFSKTPGEVARELNAIVDLGVIDDVMGRLAARLRKVRAVASVTEERLTAARVDCESLDFVDRLAADFRRLEQLAARYYAQRDRTARLRACVEEGNNLRGRRERLLGAVLGASTAAKRGDSVVDAANRAETLRNLITAAKNHRAERRRCQREADKIREQLREESGGVCPICGGPLK
jgi:hypothetical protein